MGFKPQTALAVRRHRPLGDASPQRVELVALRERGYLPSVRASKAARSQVTYQDPRSCMITGEGGWGQGVVRTVRAPSAYWRRSTFLSNLPTEVLGTSSMKAHRSGTCQPATL